MSKRKEYADAIDPPTDVAEVRGNSEGVSEQSAPDITHVPAVLSRGQHPLQAPEAGNILIATTFDVHTQAGRVLLSKCYGPPHYSLHTAAEAGVLSATGWCVYEGDVPIDGGELVRMPCVRLLLADGKILGWCSDIASEQFRRCIVSISGLPPYDPPVRFLVRRLPSKGKEGGSWYTFELAGESEAT